MKKFLIISLIFFSKSFAVDYLYLNGKVEDYSPLTNELKVKVGDGPCSRTQYFILDKNLNSKALVGKKINFVIVCNFSINSFANFNSKYPFSLS
ncbi:MAG: hypothetical protein ACP5JX_07610 [Sulfurihydrogenibium sp.]